MFELYKINKNRLRNQIIRLLIRFEGGEYRSQTLRDIFRVYHKVEIGMYSHGGCFKIGAFDKHTTIGRFCSIARTARAMNRNHPMNFKSMHAFFFNPTLQYCREDNVEYIPLKIGHDVWLGHNSIIMPHVKEIGTGAVIGAGAVLNKDVPPYAVVVGNPARVVRYRFSKEEIEELLASRWWEKSIEELEPHIHEFFCPYENISAPKSVLI